MDDLSKYVFDNYSHLMNRNESLAYKSVVGQFKLEHSKSEAMRCELQETWISSDPNVIELLSDGSDQFMHHVSERLLREHRNQIHLNYCPRCGAIARTPKARQCPKCFHSWHGAV